ncbi:MAG: bifunctional serine/threonine-protein kinase/formylglycine-generating enzyme family protein [Polyangia bacterium]
MLGSYRLLRTLGRGGMGVVYAAVHEQTGGPRAVKLIAPERAADAEYRARFRREAELAERVHHPGLVRVLDLAERADGMLYLVMEYVDGRSLRALLTEHAADPLPLAEVYRIGERLAAALAAAHTAGIVHRDVKPENILLTGEDPGSAGSVKILDFGIAKQLGDSEPQGSAPQSRGALGTVAYMAPEQLAGSKAAGAAPIDVFALGVILYELTGGRHPFGQGDTATAIPRDRILHADPQPLAALRPDAPQRLAALLQQMLDKRSFRRPSMARVASELHALSAGKPAGPRIALFFRRTMAALILILLILEAYSFYQHRALWWPRRGAESFMVRIPAQRFTMGSTAQEVEDTARWAVEGLRCAGCDKALYERELPQRAVELSGFYMDATEATNAQYAAFLNRQANLSVEGAGPFVYRGEALLLSLAREEDPRHQSYVGIYFESGRFRTRPGMERKPVVYVSLQGAEAYCLARGMRLPTEAEWELAARGVTRRRFPWGDDDPGCRDAVFARSKSGMHCSREPHGPADVASSASDRTPEGVYDLGGNVSEWTLDFFRSRYPACPQDGCREPLVATDSKLPGESGQRVVRGGSWYMEVDACRAAGRSRRAAHQVLGDIGFRCVRPL